MGDALVVEVSARELLQMAPGTVGKQTCSLSLVYSWGQGGW